MSTTELLWVGPCVAVTMLTIPLPFKSRTPGVHTYKVEQVCLLPPAVRAMTCQGVPQTPQQDLS